MRVHVLQAGALGRSRFFMGIRFFCPNGHRLHVKSFLSGKRGVCPDCGVGVEIPRESDARAVAMKGRSTKGATTDEPRSTAVLDGPEHDFSYDSPSSVVMSTPPAVGNPPRVAHGDVALPRIPASSEQFADLSLSTGKPPTATPPSNGEATQAKPVAVPKGVAVNAASAPAAADPIAEAPAAQWYVRPTAGGQYGPARGDVFRKWIGEGRVAADSLLWREGWADWRSAGEVFPSLTTGGSATGATDAAGTPAAIVPDAPRRGLRPLRKQSKMSGVGIVVALALVCVGLFAALLYVLMNSGAPPVSAP
jgi:hypothetical protein